MMTYWIDTVSKAHAENAVAGGFTEAEEGRKSRLKRLKKGDQIVFYSPRTEREGGKPVQRFTAIGVVIDETPYQEGAAWRRRTNFIPAAEAAIHPLIERLEFIGNKKSWGVTFRRGFFQIPKEDFEKIAEAMRAGG
jgi:hypothetical protein